MKEINENAVPIVASIGDMYAPILIPTCIIVIVPRGSLSGINTRSAINSIMLNKPVISALEDFPLTKYARSLPSLRWRDELHVISIVNAKYSSEHLFANLKNVILW